MTCERCDHDEHFLVCWGRNIIHTARGIRTERCGCTHKPRED